MRPQVRVAVFGVQIRRRNFRYFSNLLKILNFKKNFHRKRRDTARVTIPKAKHIGLSFFKRTDPEKPIGYNDPPSCGGAGLVSVVASIVFSTDLVAPSNSRQVSIRTFEERLRIHDFTSILVQVLLKKLLNSLEIIKTHYIYY